MLVIKNIKLLVVHCSDSDYGKTLVGVPLSRAQVGIVGVMHFERMIFETLVHHIGRSNSMFNRGKATAPSFTAMWCSTLRFSDKVHNRS